MKALTWRRTSQYGKKNKTVRKRRKWQASLPATRICDEQSYDTCTWLQQTKHKYVKKRRCEPSETARCKILVYSPCSLKQLHHTRARFYFYPPYMRSRIHVGEDIPDRPKDITGACIDCSSSKAPERRGSRLLGFLKEGNVFPTSSQISQTLLKRQNWPRYLIRNANELFIFAWYFADGLLLKELRECSYDIIPEIRARRVEQLERAPTMAGLEGLVKSERAHTRGVDGTFSTWHRERE